MTRLDLDEEKLRAAIHYICRSCESHELGKVKLHKTLWHADFAGYREFRQPLTGEGYRKDKFGPVSMHLDKMLVALADVVHVSRDEDGWSFETSTDPDMSAFSDREMEILNDSIAYVCRGHTANSISAESHDRIWQIAALHERIPYETALVAELGEVSEEDIEWARDSLRGIK